MVVVEGSEESGGLVCGEEGKVESVEVALGSHGLLRS